jgi:long-chain acyl-CoA synthetase
LIWPDFLATVVACRTSQPAVVSHDGRLSYGDLVALVGTAARTLPAPSRHHPDRVLVTETEPLPLLLKVLACWSVGRVPVILREGRSGDSAHDLARLLAACGPPTSGTTRAAPADFGPRDEALVICTSGTTSFPKLVALPAESVLLNARLIGSELGFQPGDLVGIPTPLTYMLGLMGGALSALWAGATIRLFPAAEPLTVVQAAIRREGITVIQAPPSLMRLFLAYWNGTPFAPVRLVATGGEQVTQDLVTRMREAFPQADLRMLYGMTEAGPRISHSKLGPDRTEGAVGKPFAHFDWYVEPGQKDQFPANAGRLVLRGPAMFLGYISPDGGYQGLDPDGWFRSSDLVRVDADGGLSFLDRIDRMFKSGGKLVSPREVETVLLQFAPVKEARVRPEVHPILGFVPVAEVVLHDSAPLTAQALQAHCRLHLQEHAIPRRFDLVEAMSLGPSGKRS